MMRYLKVFVYVLCILFMLPGISLSADRPAIERAAAILESSTSFHWGKDCLVWLVHYPEELVGPWIEADSSTQNYTDQQKAEYRSSFQKQLRMEDSEPFLVTVYNFGSAPLNVSPLSDYLYMTDNKGNKIALVSYEKKLDQPISGIVQGLVFFPIQKGPFELVFKGLGVYPEQIFAFPVFEKRLIVAEKSPSTEVKDHIVELPPVEIEKKPPVSKEKKVDLISEDKVVEIQKSEPSVEEPPAWLGPGPVLTVKKQEKPVIIPVSDDIFPEKLAETENPEESRDIALKKFLSVWGEGDFTTMYKMLNKEAVSRQSLKEFSVRAEKSPLRWSLAKGYKLRWLDTRRVKVSVAQKLVLIRVLQSEVLQLGMENGRWRFAW